ncbi:MULTISPECIES: DUF397 domain-containing protein [unclassified Streptomyces]|uniref:DUF397 domain-containing protein n=1 Tax=unclassified Streptomyces TaxID=2593676 RepID=UPI002255CD94|nr:MULTISPECIES: DUF397 domain-containing protein [unclassified Streptomyces]WSP55052.1 DUF397 domain-containing protein [Streptomyces sp. NBC_01241]WSU24207.1 DUF397 domain-containing protein [Streptomyces sp. NBC_01108]MCX4786729.1 DUF397 domain-containing protein [Streptomyces sp. NBC_01221]WSJ38805.1 DUF397 domain-containing protein [Streptomyces sp. NBC_01321]WSP65101.1 DUF397 domain-containing protein [Streptomyces sp. NBC_01240]
MSSQIISTRFVKSSYSSGGQGSECIEVAHTADGGRAVRDSKNRDGGLQFYAPDEWSAFIEGVKAGAFTG